jgi:Hemolysins and related proteins containing CBS domains
MHSSRPGAKRLLIIAGWRLCSADPIQIEERTLGTIVASAQGLVQHAMPGKFGIIVAGENARDQACATGQAHALSDLAVAGRRGRPGSRVSRQECGHGAVPRFRSEHRHGGKTSWASGASIAVLRGTPSSAEDHDYNTLAGMVIAQYGRIPNAGEHFDWQGWRFEVVDLDGARIDKLRV